MLDQNLDSEELLHLALAASEQGRHEDAITSLKRALSLNPTDARMYYLLGAEHAQIGMYDRAIQEMEQAVQHDPQLDTAHFQIGLIHVTSGRVEPAEKAWQPLDKLGKNHPLYLFKTGLLHLVRDEFNECVEFLQRGMAANDSNPALNRDMERVLKEAEARIVTPQTDASGGISKSEPDKHVLLSAYRKNKGDDKND